MSRWITTPVRIEGSKLLDELPVARSPQTIFLEPPFTDYYRELPPQLVDVGASGGLNPTWKRATKYLHVTEFEPREGAFAAPLAREESSTYFDICLYNEPRALDFYVTKKPTNSSIYEPNRTLHF